MAPGLGTAGAPAPAPGDAAPPGPAETTGLFAQVEHRYPGSGAEIRATLHLPPEPAVTVLLGPSGAGKTTLLRCLVGLERPQGGRILFGGEAWFDAERGLWVPPQGRRLGYVAQEDALFPHLSVAANVAYGLRNLPAAERDRRTAETLRLLELEALAGRRPATLSGGQRRRVALARALAPGPRLLVLDEPLTGLDAVARDEILAELRRLVGRLGVPILLVTHDLTEALSLGDRLAVLVGGRIRQEGGVEEVCRHPADAEVARVVGVDTLVRGRVVGHREGLVAVEAAGRTLLAALPPSALDGQPVPGQSPAADGTACLASIPGRPTIPGQPPPAGPWLPGAPVWIAIRAEDVVLAAHRPARGPSGTASGAGAAPPAIPDEIADPAALGTLSARNRLPGRIAAIEARGPVLRVTVDCGFPLAALVTRLTATDLGIAPGAPVTALVKAPAVHLLPLART